MSKKQNKLDFQAQVVDYLNENLNVHITSDFKNQIINMNFDINSLRKLVIGLNLNDENVTKSLIKQYGDRGCL